MTYDEMALDIGERVRNARESQGMTVDQLAEKAELFAYVVEEVESDFMLNLHLIDAISLADALGMTLSEMTGR